ncbi:N-acetylglucosamine-6-phosphate deacetylase [Paenibacillus sp. JCM 10914]|uniref:N-acetylglucosamine-6-phosphate deacetylase n=1 Tax=Paenibacillus sp. JCM 10914 TaxID=1236974 RepID=UPI0003CCA2A8|nr:amidohydrolase family protein [Paenibacillus sp. JCM 10914]GAE06141.1 N-acetylglucosamine-6-phosphate deacetylase [Paenibacillus sp. JCM 10914]
MLWRGRLSDTGESVEVRTKDGRITAITHIPLDDAPCVSSSDLPWISSGWIDLQVNGFGGYDLNGTVTSQGDIEGVTKALHKRGVALYLPTVITGSYDRMRQAFSALSQYSQSGLYGSASLAGIHMEGPYLSGEDGSRGAHPREYIRNPDWAEFQQLQDAAGGLIKMVTLAPEREGSIPFIRQLVKAGVVVAIGHTMATAEQLDQAADAGATVSTHLGNGSQPVLPRHPNYIWQQLAEDRLWATFIPDGHHLAPPVLKAMLRAKRDKAVLVSDAVMFAGMAAGRYSSLIGGEVELTAAGRLHTVENPAILAGSASSLDIGIANAVRYTDMSLAEAVSAVTSRPAEVLDTPQWGELKIGHPANLTLFAYDESTSDLVVQETVVAGESVYRSK